LETCLDVANLPRSREFYAGLFGYSVIQSDDRFCAFSVGGRQVLLLFVRGTDPQVTTLPFGTIPPHGAIGPARVGFSIPSESLPAWRERLARLGIPIESSFTWLGSTRIYCRDPVG
jgi:catechol-2,3-dioxygenase